MSEEAELQAKIAALAGRINQHKQTSSSSPPPPHHGYSGGYHQPSTRWSPYSHQPAYPRGGGYHKPAHRNKTLVVNNGGNHSNKVADASAPAEQAPGTPGWVSKRDRGHMQLINTSVYDQKMQQKQLEMEETARQKQQLRDEKEKSKVLRHVHGVGSSSGGGGGGGGGGPSTVPTSTTPREIVINDLRFRVSADGSKLIRIFGKLIPHHTLAVVLPLTTNADGSKQDPQTTPKQAKIAGVTFHRSKNGNLYRSGLVKKQLSTAIPRKSAKLCPKFTSTGTQNSNHRHKAHLRQLGSHKPQTLLNSLGRPSRPLLTLETGICPLGNRCSYTHDINKIAICQQFLRHGTCAAGEECNLSHDPTPNRVPLCIHFLRGSCTNEDCRYAHVGVSSTAPVCRPFATMGYCEKGAECTDRHVFECPDYADTGNCRNAKCRLPHVDSVANKRRAEATKAARSSPDGADSSDLSSDEEDYQAIDPEDVDSDDLDDDVVMSGAGAGDHGHELTRQQDFISFT